MSLIVGLTGSMGVGKSTAVQTFNERTDGNVTLVKFAQPLYDMQEYIYKRIEKTYKRPSTFIKDRKLLQWLGTEWGRGIDTYLWVNEWRQQAIDALVFGRNVVCDDVRFDNEAATIKELGGIIVQITSSKIDDRDNVVKNGISNHASEAGIDKRYVDYVIKNDDTLETYKSSLNELFVKLMKEGK